MSSVTNMELLSNEEGGIIMRSKFVGSKIFSLVLVIFMLMMFSLSTVGNVAIAAIPSSNRI